MDEAPQLGWRIESYGSLSLCETCASCGKAIDRIAGETMIWGSEDGEPLRSYHWECWRRAHG